MLKKQKHALRLLGLLGLLLLAFNNCSKAGFEVDPSIRNSFLTTESSISSVPIISPVIIPPIPTPIVPVGSISILVGQGYVGRTMISCDLGKTWVADKSDNDSQDCGTDGGVCDHGPYNSMGITSGNGWFVGTWGHGGPGSVRRSKDGVSWEKVLDQTSFSGVGFANNKFMAFDSSDQAKKSSDNAATWTSFLTGPGINFYGLRSTYATDSLPGLAFITSGDDGNMRISPDGVTWTSPTNRDKVCEGGSAYIAGAGLLLQNFSWSTPGYTLNDAGGVICKSSDAGNTWKPIPLPGFWMTNRILFNGQKFISYGIKQPYDGLRMTSSIDGVTWASEKVYLRRNGVTSLADVNFYLGEIHYANSVFIATTGAYATQKFYRSTDGILWDELPGTSYKQGHPIKHFTDGLATKSAECH